jgi:hypothetical protein
MHGSRVVDHVDRGPSGQVQGAHLPGPSPADLSVLARVVWAQCTVTDDFRKPVVRTVKDIATSLDQLQIMWFNAFRQRTSGKVVSGDTMMNNT